MKDMAELIEYYGVPDMPIIDYTSVDAFRTYIEQYRNDVDGVSISEFLIVRNVTRINIDEIWDDPELEGLKADYFEEFCALVVRVNVPRPHASMHGTLNDLLRRKLDGNGIDSIEYSDIDGSAVGPEGGFYSPGSSSINTLHCEERGRTKQNMVITAGWSQSLQSLRAQARDYMPGQIVRRRTEPDTESLVGNRLGNQLAVCSVDILNTRIEFGRKSSI
jgi:hypothetical protein